MTDWNILHCFADTGAEADTLQHYGNVVRIGIDASPNQSSDAIKADAHSLPFAESTTFDLGWLHPPCGFVSPMSETHGGSQDDWPNLLPLARDIADTHCEHWVLENKPSEYINPEVTLAGDMFGLDIAYKRAFETNFPIPQPPAQSTLAETSPFFYSEKARGWWLGQKGCGDAYTTEHVAKNTIPAAYINHIMAAFADFVNDPEQDYSEYDKEMETKRQKLENQELGDYA